MICNSRFLNRLSCKTFLMATTSFVSTTFASKTTPKLPLPMIRSALYDMLSCSVGTPGEFGATGVCVVVAADADAAVAVVDAAVAAAAVDEVAAAPPSEAVLEASMLLLVLFLSVSLVDVDDFAAAAPVGPTFEPVDDDAAA